MVCDVTRPLTTKSVENWKKVLDDKVRLPSGAPIPVVLIANKTDLLKSGTESFNTGIAMQKVCTENGFDDVFVASAKENTNISEAVGSLLDKMMLNYREQAISSKPTGSRAATVTNKVRLDEGDGACRVGAKRCAC